MSAHGFKSVFMVGAIASAALGCYLISLRVASERAALESVENKIVLAQRDIRLLNTEIGTRGRLAQLERWNVKVIRLSAPAADQFVESSFQLATLVKPEARPAVDAPLVYASAPAPVRHDPVVTNDDDGATGDVAPERASRPLGEMIHVASYRPAPRPAAPIARAIAGALAGPSPAKAVAGKSAAPKGAAATLKAATAGATKLVKTATADPLGPLSRTAGKAKSGPATAPRAAPVTTKDSGSH